MATDDVTRLMRMWSSARAAWGVAVLLVPRQVLALAGRVSPPRRAVTVVRLLGGRQLAQSALTAVAPSARAARLGAAVDALHALTMLALAGTARWRQPALADAFTAFGPGATGLRIARRGPAAHRSSS